MRVSKHLLRKNANLIVTHLKISGNCFLIQLEAKLDKFSLD